MGETLGRVMRGEILDQPAVFERILRDGRTSIDQVAQMVRRRQPRFVVFVARGTSDNAALYGKYLVETRLRLPAGMASPSSSSLYASHLNMKDVLLIAVSQSGASPDVAGFTEDARAGGAITVAITNQADSPLAGAGEFHLNLLAGNELAVAATKTYTAELLTLFLLIEAIRDGDASEIAMLPAAAESMLEAEPAVRELAAGYRFADHLLVTSRGYNFPTALETALKLVETSLIPAHAFSGADLMHGPMAMIDRGFPVIVIAPEGRGGRAMEPVLKALHEKHADILLVGSGTSGYQAALTVARVCEHLSPLLSIIPMQLFALHLARRRGHDPDAPRGLTKITLTV